MVVAGFCGRRINERVAISPGWAALVEVVIVVGILVVVVDETASVVLVEISGESVLEVGRSVVIVVSAVAIGLSVLVFVEFTGTRVGVISQEVVVVSSTGTIVVVVTS